MERALHPELAKRIVNRNPQNGRSSLGQQSAMTLVQGTRNGGGKDTPPEQMQKDVVILDIFQNAAQRTRHHVRLGRLHAHGEMERPLGHRERALGAEAAGPLNRCIASTRSS